MLRLDLCDYSDAYVLVRGTITVPNTGIAAALNNPNKKRIFKNSAAFTDCISEINTKETDHDKDIHVVIPLYNLIEYSHNYSKISGSLCQYYTDEGFICNNGVIVNVPDDLDSASFKYKQEITQNDRTKDVQIMIPLKYLSSFWRTFEMPLINCKINIFFNLV